MQAQVVQLHLRRVYLLHEPNDTFSVGLDIANACDVIALLAGLEYKTSYDLIELTLELFSLELLNHYLSLLSSLSSSRR